MMTPDKTDKTLVKNSNLYEFSRELIINSRKTVYQVANFQMVETYWRIGEKIVEEQEGEMYAKYGEGLLQNVSERLMSEFGKGFSYVNLTLMRKFRQLFPNVYALRKELSWTHYRSLLRVENPKARDVYMNEAAENAWSTRFLDEQVGKHHFERLIATHKEAVNEIKGQDASHLPVNPADAILIKNMYVRMYDKMRRAEGDNPTIGIILCEEKDKTEVKFSILNDGGQLFATKYKLCIPSEEELKREITQIRSLMRDDG